MARQFGIISDPSGSITGCVLNTVKKSTSAKTAEARDAAGKVTDRWLYSLEESVALSGVMDATSLSLKAGDSITFGGKTFGISETSVQESNTGAATFTIEGSLVDSATIHTYASSSVTSGGSSGTQG